MVVGAKARLALSVLFTVRGIGAVDRQGSSACCGRRRHQEILCRADRRPQHFTDRVVLESGGSGVSTFYDRIP